MAPTPRWVKRPPPRPHAGAHRPRAPATVAACALLALALGACGERRETLAAPAARPYTPVLSEAPGPEEAGIYSAAAVGAYAAVGLDVRPAIAADGPAALKALSTGNADIAVAGEADVLAARDAGSDLIAVAALVQRPLASLIAPARSGISTPAKLAGHTVAGAGAPLEAAALQTALVRSNVAPARVRLLSGPSAKHADATLGGRLDREGLALELAHKNPIVIPFDKLGVPVYSELVLVVRRADAQRRGRAIRAFLQALTRGEEAVRTDPSAAVGTLAAANPRLDRRLALGALHRSIGSYFPTDPNRAFGYIDLHQWQAFGNWMFATHQLTRPPDAAAALTNEFLPGQGI